MYRLTSSCIHESIRSMNYNYSAVLWSSLVNHLSELVPLLRHHFRGIDAFWKHLFPYQFIQIELLKRQSGLYCEVKKVKVSISIINILTSVASNACRSVNRCLALDRVLASAISSSNCFLKAVECWPLAN